MDSRKLVHLTCWNCNSILPHQAIYCPDCGAKQFSDEKRSATKRHHLDQLFKKYLTDFILQYFGQLRTKSYLQQFEQALEFQRLKDQQIEALLQQLNAPVHLHQRLINQNFNSLVHNFIVEHCPVFYDIRLSRSVLNYLWEDGQSVDLLSMALDFLDFAHEPTLEVYNDLNQMPSKALKNTFKHYLFPEASERVLLICDDSLLRNGKSGFAITDRALYWRASMSKAKVVYYEKIGPHEINENWAMINGHFFNIKLSLNVKLLLYLRMVQQLLT